MIRNGFELDYCFEACIRSLIPVCDEVVVCDSDSTDGTAERLAELAAAEPKVRLLNRPWPGPNRELTWWTDWINWTRGHLKFPMQLQLDADEVLCPGAYEEIRKAVSEGTCRYFQRLNFYGDARHIAAIGHVCGYNVARLGPSHYWMPSDEPHPEGEPEIRKQASKHDSLRIFHYGFLRDDAAFYRKSDVVQNAFFGQVDERLGECQRTGQDWAQRCPVPLVEFRGSHPPVAMPWLKTKKRGFK